MSKNAEILLEGSYLYFQDEVQYSQENFKLVRFSNEQSFHIYSEILSRIETGEFLKIMIRYEMNQHYYPNFLRIEKSLGNKYCQEVFKIDAAKQEINYTFQNAQVTQEYKKSFNPKHYITCPAFATSTIFTLSRKFDATGRTPVIFLGSGNEWTYEKPPEEKIIYAEFLSKESDEFKINNNPIPSSHLRMYEFDSSSTNPDSPADVYISKYHGIPYQLINGNQKIIIKNLKKNF